MATPVYRLKFNPSRRKRTFKYEYLSTEAETQFYEDFANSVELEFGKYSRKVRVLKRLYQDGKEQRITAEEVGKRAYKLFKDHTELSFKFADTVLPYLYPLGTLDEVIRANQFISIVKSAFPNNEKRIDAVVYHIVGYRDGILTLREMTVKMLKLMDNRDELIKAYIRFVPQSEDVIANMEGRKSFFSYLVIAIFVAFGVGLYTLKKRLALLGSY